jgi:hypothetical protein
MGNGLQPILLLAFKTRQFSGRAVPLGFLHQGVKLIFFIEILWSRICKVIIAKFCRVGDFWRYKTVK